MLKRKRAPTNSIPRKLLSQACERNCTVELFSTQDERVGRSRLLAVREQDFLIDRPLREGRQVTLPPGTQLLVHLWGEGMRWSFRTTVVDRERIRLNTRVAVEAVAVSMPSTVRLTQRRRHYRVPLAAEKDVLCWLSETPEQREGGEPSAPDALAPSRRPGRSTRDETNEGNQVARPAVGERRVVAVQVVNLSEGGLAVAYDNGGAVSPETGQTVRVRLDLSDGSEPLVFDAEVRHRRLIRETDRYVAGLRFRDFLQPSDVERAVARIGKFVAMMQRRHLARTRAGG